MLNKSRRSAADMIRVFYVSLHQVAEALANKTMQKADFIEYVVSTLRNLATDAYEEGAGIRYAMEDEDDSFISDWLNLQRQNIADFAEAIVDKGLTQEIESRLKLWAGSLDTLAGVGYIRANQDKLGRWKLGSTNESCATCRSLEGRIARLGWFLDNGYLPRQPGSATLACGGWKCGCGIFDYVTGRRILPLVRMWY